jgi:hypothetical protein
MPEKESIFRRGCLELQMNCLPEKNESRFHDFRANRSGLFNSYRLPGNAQGKCHFPSFQALYV